jgi:hypothetical protein
MASRSFIHPTTGRRGAKDKATGRGLLEQQGRGRVRCACGVSDDPISRLNSSSDHWRFFSLSKPVGFQAHVFAGCWQEFVGDSVLSRLVKALSRPPRAGDTAGKYRA